VHPQILDLVKAGSTTKKNPEKKKPKRGLLQEAAVLEKNPGPGEGDDFIR